MTSTLPLVAAVAALAFNPAARAQIIAYDGFAYTPGQSLDGQNGGLGFAGPWTVTGGTVIVQSGSLTPAAPADGLATTGNSLSATGINPVGGATRPLSTPEGTAGSVLWISAVMKGTGVNSLSAATEVILTDGTFDGFTISSGTISNANWGLADAGAGTVTASSSVPNSLQSLLVVRATFGSTNDVYDLFVNPPLTGSPPATPDTSLTLTHGPALGVLKVVGASLSGAVSLFDEIHLGNTFTDVTTAPVPEPSAMLLVGIAGLGLMVRRRQCRKT